MRWAGSATGIAEVETIDDLAGVVADFDADGLPETLGLQADGTVAFLDETSSSPTATALPSGRPVAQGDFDDDGILDVVLSASGVVVVSDALGAATEQRLHVDVSYPRVSGGMLTDDSLADLVFGSTTDPGVYCRAA